jgi:hypothetical protein
MENIAAIKNGIVENVIAVDSATRASTRTHLESQGYTCVDDAACGPGDTYADGQFTPKPVEPKAPQPRYISVGAFFDRFADQKWPILSSTDAAVQGMIRDASVRKWIDLDNAQLPGGIDMLIAKGFAVDKDSILSAPIQPDELP